jgi:glycerol uptake facilitator-like aquaporin
MTFGPISAAHFNPVVSVADAVERGLSWFDAFAYTVAQCSGGILGTVLAHAMFGLRLLSLSRHARSGSAQLLSEFVAAFGLLCVIWGCSRSRSGVTPFAVAAYITAAYWFTASTSFANPAVTIARSLSDPLRESDQMMFCPLLPPNSRADLRVHYCFVGWFPTYRHAPEMSSYPNAPINDRRVKDPSTAGSTWLLV